MAIRTDDTNNCHNNNETTEVLRGVGNVINAELEFFANSKKMVGTCMNCTRPQWLLCFSFKGSLLNNDLSKVHNALKNQNQQ
jgi:hypothetical protein